MARDSTFAWVIYLKSEYWRGTRSSAELLDARPQLQDFLAELRFSEVHNIETRHDRRCSAQPRAVERGTPRSMAMVTSTVRWTRSRRRWS